MSPLRVACSVGHLDLAKHLLDAGADVNHQDKVVLFSFSSLLSFLPYCELIRVSSFTTRRRMGKRLCSRLPVMDMLKSSNCYSYMEQTSLSKVLFVFLSAPSSCPIWFFSSLTCLLGCFIRQREITPLETANRMRYVDIVKLLLEHHDAAKGTRISPPRDLPMPLGPRKMVQDYLLAA